MSREQARSPKSAISIQFELRVTRLKRGGIKGYFNEVIYSILLVVALRKI